MKSGRERSFFIDSLPRLNLPVATLESQGDKVDLANPGASLTRGVAEPTQRSSEDPIAAVCASDSTLIVARASGSLVQFSLPNLVLESINFVKTRAATIELNSNSTRAAIIDINGALSLFDFELAKITSTVGIDAEVAKSKDELQNFARRDVWQMKW